MSHLQKVQSHTRRHSSLTLLWKSSPCCQVSFFCCFSAITSRVPRLHVCNKCFALSVSVSFHLVEIHPSVALSVHLSLGIHPSVCLSFCLSSLQSLCGEVFESSTACSACQLQSVQHGGQLRRPNLPWQSAETARPSKMWSLCGQDNVDLTCPLCNHCGSIVEQEISGVFSTMSVCFSFLAEKDNRLLVIRLWLGIYFIITYTSGLSLVHWSLYSL